MGKASEFIPPVLGRAGAQGGCEQRPHPPSLSPAPTAREPGRQGPAGCGTRVPSAVRGGPDRTLGPAAFTPDLHVSSQRQTRLAALGKVKHRRVLGLAGWSRGLWTLGWELQPHGGDFTPTTYISERAGWAETLQGAAKGVQAVKRPRAERTRRQRNEGTPGDEDHTGDTRDRDEARSGVLRRADTPGGGAWPSAATSRRAGRRASEPSEPKAGVGGRSGSQQAPVLQCRHLGVGRQRPPCSPVKARLLGLKGDPGTRPMDRCCGGGGHGPQGW